MINLESVNKTHDNVMWLASTPQVERDWHLLVTAIGQVKPRDEDITIPAMQEPWAWKRAWALYDDLRRRGAVQVALDPGEAAGRQQQVASDRLWQAYVNALPYLVKELGHAMDRDAIFAWIGLQPDDLLPAMSDDAEAVKFGGRRPGWPAIAARVTRGLDRYRRITPEQRWLIPWLVAIAQLEDEVKALKARVSELEGERDGRLQ